MANADQILSLIRNHLNNDDAQFRKVALQISAVEAKNGHAVLARTIQELLSQRKTSFSALKLIPRNKDVDDLLLQKYGDGQSIERKDRKSHQRIYKERRT